MTEDEFTQEHARSFGSVADAYDRARPGYPEAAARWLIGRDAAVVLELGAGTGQLTETLVSLGHDVHATDPDEAMLARLRERVPGVRATVAGAEEIPAADESVDVVVVAQAFHWFDQERALPEIVRVLKPGGHLALVWNDRDERIPWVRRLGAVLGSQEQLREPHEALAGDLFGEVEEERFTHWQQINRASIVDLALSRSHVAVLDTEAREAKLAEVLAFYDDYGRGMDGMQLPYVAHCYRVPVRPDAPRPQRDVDEESPMESTGPIVDPHPGDDDDLLLIDFR